LPSHQRRLAELRESGRQLEESLSARYAALSVRPIAVTLEAVQRKLPAGTALVEYFAYRPCDRRSKTGSEWGRPRYVAYVLLESGEPRWTELGDAEAIDKLAREVRLKFATSDRAAPQAARALDRLVMQPVRRLLGDATNVLLSPDGDLNLVPFDALADEHGEYLVKKYRLTYLSSGRDLLHFGTRAGVTSAPTILAAPDYGDNAAKPSTKDKASEQGQRSMDMGAIRFPPLPGTLTEANRLARLLPGSRLLTGKNATEAALKSLRAPRLLHLATHGFFLDDLPAPELRDNERGIGHVATLGLPKTTLPEPGLPASATLSREVGRLENPLLRSGIALAGANLRRSGDDDGILTPVADRRREHRLFHDRILRAHRQGRRARRCPAQRRPRISRKSQDRRSEVLGFIHRFGQCQASSRRRRRP